MRQLLFEIKENIPLTKDIMKMTLIGDTCDITRPGQFVNIKLEGLYLRRPISVCDCEDGALTLIYKVVGKGTEQMRNMKKGEKLDVLISLGNGYDLSRCGEKPLLIGGGVGVPPLYMLAKELRKTGKAVSVILGFNTKEEVFYEEEFKALGCEVYVTTVDGSYKTAGFVTEVMKKIDYTDFCTCGPEPMLRTVYNESKTDGQLSFEERMGCGFGACMGCSCKTLTGFKRICKDGPIMMKEELLWNA